jgi:hypothetical protein
MENVNNKKIYFKNIEVPDIILEILKKYSLEETQESVIKKMTSTSVPFLSRPGFIFNLIIKIIKKEILQKDVSPLLQKEFNISQKIADEIVNEINTKIVPMATTEKPPSLQATNNENNNLANIISKSEPQISVSKTLPTPDITEPQEKKIGRPKKISPDLDKDLEKPAVPEIKKPSGSDNYREPLS